MKPAEGRRSLQPSRGTARGPRTPALPETTKLIPINPTGFGPPTPCSSNVLNVHTLKPLLSSYFVFSSSFGISEDPFIDVFLFCPLSSRVTKAQLRTASITRSNGHVCCCTNEHSKFLEFNVFHHLSCCKSKAGFSLSWRLDVLALPASTLRF